MVAARNDTTEVRLAARGSALGGGAQVVEGCWEMLIGLKDSDGHVVVAFKDLRLRFQTTKQPE